MCKVVNFKMYGGNKDRLQEVFGDNWTYIGRENKYAGVRASVLANPYRRGKGEQDSTLGNYRKWLWAKIQAGDEDVIKALRRIDKHTILVCWCKPGPCHGDVVKAAAKWLKTQEG